ncbi:MAG: STAS domain-containing protein [Xanthomonadaceae bacterium]|nr:STAS domain-containing protein [Xanthomonadaceae bacterium]
MSTIRKEGDKVFINPGQDVVTPVIKDFQRELQEIVAEKPAELVIDLEGVGLVDSTGLGLFIAAYNSLKQNQGTVTIINAKDNVLDVLMMTHLNRIFNIVTE